jgi:hypothetical protein
VLDTSSRSIAVASALGKTGCMTDFFALLGQLRRPWLEPDELKARYFALAQQVHPDRYHDAPLAQQQAAAAHHAELNAAYQYLREPKNRLLHLLELELGRKPEEIQDVPTETMELFVEVGQLCSGVDAFLAGHGKVSSPILKAKVFEEGLEWTDRLQKMQEDLSVRREVLEDRLRAIDAAWNTASDPRCPASSSSPWPELEQLYREFSFLGRWFAQLQQRIVQLSL